MGLIWPFSLSSGIVQPEKAIKTLVITFQAYKSDSGPVTFVIFTDSGNRSSRLRSTGIVSTIITSSRIRPTKITSSRNRLTKTYPKLTYLKQI